MRRILLLLIVLALTFTVTACGGENKASDKKAEEKVENKVVKEVVEKPSDAEIVKYDNLGLQFAMPKIWKENEASNVLNYDILGSDYADKDQPTYGMIQFNFLPEEIIKDAKEKSKTIKTEEELMKLFTDLLEKQRKICRIVVAKKDKFTNEEKEKEFKGFKITEKVAELDGRVYYFGYNDKYDETGLSKENKALFQKLYKEVENVKKSVKAIKIEYPKKK